MDNYLPVVNQEIAGPMVKDIINYNDTELLEEQLKELEEINPIIAMWIKNFSEKTGDQLGAAFCGLFVYKLLNNQAEVDFMNKTFS